MASRKESVEDKVGRKPIRPVASEAARVFADHLAQACKICIRNAALTRFGHIVFQDGAFQAFDGCIQMQAPSIFPAESIFALSESKLSSALSLTSPVDAIIETAEMIKLTRGPLGVRVKKADAALGFFEPFKMSKGAKKADGLLAALRHVEPFMSEDATRPWSVSALLADGYAYATNNLALVRSPLPAIFDEPLSIPLPAMRVLCSLPSIDRIERPSEGRIRLSCGDACFQFSTGSAGWPEMPPLFKKLPKKMPPLPPEMREATEAAAKLSDRFISLGANKVESKSDIMDSTYEVDLKGGSGLFSARILALIAQVATHAEFSFFPDPIFFRGEGIEGTAVGARTV